MNQRSGIFFKSNVYFINLFLTIFIIFVLLMMSGCVSGIHQAAETGDKEKIKSLLDEDPSLVNETDSYGMTPLHWAVDKGHRSIADFLIDKGADINAKDKNGDTPLRYAVGKEAAGMATMLILEGAVISAKEEDLKDMLKSIAPLHQVARDGHLGNLKTLLKKYPDQVNARDDLDRTPLYWAARADYIEVCELLLANGADVNAATPDGWTPLHTSVYNKKTKAVELLLANGANVNAKNNDGETPLHWAVRRGKRNIIEALITKNADVNAADNNGKTPKDWADDNEIIELLQAQGKGKSGRTGDR